MKTWVLTTHYDCEVYATLHPSMEAAYQKLKQDWVNECDPDDCGHDPEMTSISDIADALEWHFEEMDYQIEELEVPATEQAISPVAAPTPERNMMPVGRAEDLLSALQSYRDQ